MDVKMPRMDGVQLLERVKAIDAGVEVVMITAYASLDTVQRAMRFGAMDYLVKPFAPRELQEAAERALARRRQRTAGPGRALAPLIGKMRISRSGGSGAGRRPRRAPAGHAARGSAGHGGRRRFLPGHGAGHGRACRAARRGGGCGDHRLADGALRGQGAGLGPAGPRVAAAVAGRAGRSRLRGGGGGAGDRRGAAARLGPSSCSITTGRRSWAAPISPLSGP